jgi:hypothetical protein
MEKALRDYLSDHWAGSKAGLSLARRALRSESSGALALFLSRFIQELEQDREVLGDVMNVVGSASPVKAGIAWMGERSTALAEVASRALGRSGLLNQVMELEGLMMATQGRIGLWQSLIALKKSKPELQSFDFESLLERAQLHRSELERHRLQLAKRAFKETPALGSTGEEVPA